MGDARVSGRILIARHGQTAWNLEGRRLGREDIPLDDVGPEQARQLRDRLAGERIDAIYASPLGRAHATASPLARASGIEVQLDDDLLEFDFGAASGSSRAEVKLRLRRDHLTTPIPGGESLQDVWLRAERFLRRLRAELRPDAQVVVVGHRRTNRMLVGILHGLKLEQAAAADHYRPDAGSLVAFAVAVADDSLRLADVAG